MLLPASGGGNPLRPAHDKALCFLGDVLFLVAGRIFFHKQGDRSGV
jgi:hypothetical protein